MAVTLVKPSSMGSSGNASGTSGQTVKASYRASYRVTCSSAADTIDEVLKHFRITASLPWPGRRFKFGNGFNASVLCNDVQADQVEKGDGQFIATCKFESLEPQEGSDGQTPDGQQTENPLQFHDEIEVSYQSISIPVEKATLFGTDPLGINNPILQKGYQGPIINSAGKPYQTALEKEVRIKVLRITKYSAGYSDSIFEPYMDAINNDVFVINKPQYNFSMRVNIYRCKFGNIGSSFGLTNGIKFYRSTVELLITKLPYGWLRLVPDMGRDRRQYPELDKDDFGNTISNDNVLVSRRQLSTSIKDENGFPVQDPVLLDGNGQPLEKGKKPVFFIWHSEELKPFAPLAAIL